jgi:hypothetical protein
VTDVHPDRDVAAKNPLLDRAVRLFELAGG